MGKVTYLFGAGASCECLPLVKDIPSRLEKFMDFMAEQATGSTTLRIGVVADLKNFCA